MVIIERYRKALNLQAIELGGRDLLEELRDLSALVEKRTAQRDEAMKWNWDEAHNVPAGTLAFIGE